MSAPGNPISAPPSRAQQFVAQWLLPSFSDVVFLIIFLLLLARMGSGSSGLLRDADTGWHIVNGQIILATHHVPRVDPFSYTRAGQPWFAWEWLFDLLAALVHQWAGLNGVALIAIFTVALTFALLFRALMRRSGHILISAALAIFAVCCAQVHMLARPHVFSWLFTVLFVHALFRAEEGSLRALIPLPLYMVLWVNLHGGFVIGLAFIVLFAVAAAWRHFGLHAPGQLRLLRALGLTFLASSAATLVTPYGIELHRHVFTYLSSSYLMNVIQEFASPSFHSAAGAYFEAYLLLAVAVAALAWRRLSTTDLILLLFALHIGLYATRNIPIAVILFAFVIVRPLAGLLGPAADNHDPAAANDPRPAILISCCTILDGVAHETAALDRQMRGHLAVLLTLAVVLAAALNGGHLAGVTLMAERFDPAIFPVQATDYIARAGIRDHMYNPDDWSGYLIYRLYPRLLVSMDDRHDFYGEAFVREYGNALNGGITWEKFLTDYQMTRALTPVNSTLASLLILKPDWRVEYQDKVATLFCRHDVCPTPVTPHP